MLFSSCVDTCSATAAAARAADVVLRAPADKLDTNALRAFSRQLGTARRVARAAPAVAAQLLSAWMSRNG